MLNFPRIKTGLLKDNRFTEGENDPWTSSKSRWGTIITAKPDGSTATAHTIKATNTNI
jgi:hypothetical protein